MQNTKTKFALGALTAVLMFVVGMSVGCNKNSGKAQNDSKSTQTKQSGPLPPEPLTMLVIGDEELGERTQRQWSARRDGTLTINNMDAQSFIDSGFEVSDDVDVVVYPPAMIGELAKLKRIQAVPRRLWESDEFNKNSLLRHFRMRIVRYQDVAWGVPLGSPTYALLANRKLIDELKIKLPTTWSKLENTLNKVAGSESGLPSKIDMPLSEGWAAKTFLVHVSSAIRNRGKISTVFKRKQMEPLIASQPFVQALERIKRTASERSLEFGPKEIFELANAGKSSFALAWPARGFSPEFEAADELIDDVLTIGPVPGTTQWFDQGSNIWHARPKDADVHVDLVGFTGLVASVNSASMNDNTAWDFLEWWSSQKISHLTVTDSPSVGPFRASQLGDMGLWSGESISADVADEYADVVAASHERSLCFMFPKISGQHLYIKALDAKVREYISGTGSPEDALNAVAAQWDEITDEIGRDAQANQLRKD